MSYREDLIAREVDELMGLVASLPADVEPEIIRKALLTSLNYVYGLGVGRQNEG